MTHDLILRGGEVIDLATGHLEAMDVGFDAGHLSVLAPHNAADGRAIVDVRGSFIVPGLIDIHTHVFPGYGRASIPTKPAWLAVPPPRLMPAPQVQ